MEQINKETEELETKFTTLAYTIQAKEWEVTENLLETLCALEQFFREGKEVLDIFIPQARNLLDSSTKKKVYGVDLLQHLRYEVMVKIITRDLCSVSKQIMMVLQSHYCSALRD